MILLLHNRYRTPGGEERVVEDLARILPEHLGEEVEVLQRDSAALSSSAEAGASSRVCTLLARRARRSVGSIPPELGKIM